MTKFSLCRIICHKQKGVQMNFSGENTFDQIRSKLMPHLTDDEWRTAKIFNMHLFEKIENIFKNNIRFVHYTSAEVALSIISNKKIWLRNSTCMNDYSEVHHGVKAIIDFFKPEGNAGDFWKSLDNISFELSNEIKNLFDSRIHDLTTSTYLTCLSEHDKEEQTGRLSMWRGYGRNSGVAIVVNQNALMASDIQHISSKTFESTLVPGLFFIGEVLDVTGHLGGYNFQWAWASGHAAGQYV